MWEYHFDEDGGYDCMSGAYIITKQNSTERIVIDAANFGWHRWWEDRPQHADALLRMEYVAKAIVGALNQLDGVTNETPHDPGNAVG